MDTATTPTRQRVWVTTAEACAALGMSRETLRQLRLRGVLTPGKHYRRWGCTQGRLEPAASAPLMLDPPDCGGGRALRVMNNRSGRPGKGRKPIDA